MTASRRDTDRGSLLQSTMGSPQHRYPLRHERKGADAGADDGASGLHGRSRTPSRRPFGRDTTKKALPFLAIGGTIRSFRVFFVCFGEASAGASAPPRTHPSRRTPRPERRPRDTSRVTDRRPRIPRASNVFCDGSVPPPPPRPVTRAANALKKKSQENEPTTPRRVPKTPPPGACTSASAPCLTRRASARSRSRRFPSARAGCLRLSRPPAGSIRAKNAKTARRRR